MLQNENWSRSAKKIMFTINIIWTELFSEKCIKILNKETVDSVIWLADRL